MPEIGISFEFFPPKTNEGKNKLSEVAKQLATKHPEYFSVTFGAGGSTKTNSLDTVLHLKQLLSSEIAPHLSCIGASQDAITELLNIYRQHDIKKIVALRGDIPSGMHHAQGDFKYACDLIDFIRKTSGNYFHIEAACYPEFHPEAQDPESDFQAFLQKVRAGADGAISQYFYNSDAYFHFLEKAHQHQVNIPIVPGIMPITNFHRLCRFSDACDAEIPKWIRKQIEFYQDDEQALYQFGIDVVTTLCEQLIAGGAPALHFYTLNDAKASMDILANLSLTENTHVHTQNLYSQAT